MARESVAEKMLYENTGLRGTSARSEILWAYQTDVPPVRNNAQDRSETIKTLQRMPEKTGRVQYVRKSDITP